MRNVSCVLIAACFGGAASAAELPSAISACLKTSGAGYEVSRKVDPFYLRADFDGDGNSDYAVIVLRARTQGIVVCWGNGAAPVVLGAGRSFNDMKDLDFTAWQVHSRNRRVAQGRDAGRRPVLSGDALLLEWESASAIVYWSGHHFIWYQQGD